MLIHVIIAIIYSRRLSKSELCNIWRSWIKGISIAFFLTFIVHYLFSALPYYADAFHESNHLEVAKIAFVATIAVWGIIYVPITFIGVLAAMFSKKNTEKATELTTCDKKCPFCAEAIKAEALICRFCGGDQILTQKSTLNS